MPKYIFENGVMKLNPAENKQTTVPQPDKALAIVSSPEDIMAASDLQTAKTGQPMPLPPSTVASMEIMQDTDFQKQLGSTEALDGLCRYFSRYEVPIGLVNKLLGLMEHTLRFLVDDSGSMQNETDVLAAQASPHMKDRLKGHTRSRMLRIHEVEDRLHIFIDMLSYIPTGPIVISFFNTKDIITLKHAKGKNPDAFAADAHRQISDVFSRLNYGGTPTHSVLSKSFKESSGLTAHYLFTDGQPTDATPQAVSDLIKQRTNPERNPVTLLSCTDNDAEVEWMKDIEEVALYTSEIDDFENEYQEVLKDQGPGLPFSRGFWLLCQLVAAMNPDDLDALDESVPLTKMTLDNLMGRTTTPQEYQYYFDRNPHGAKYRHLLQRFASEQKHARQIVPKEGTAAATGYTPQFAGASGGAAAAGYAYPPSQAAATAYPPPAYTPI